MYKLQMDVDWKYFSFFFLWVESNSKCRLYLFMLSIKSSCNEDGSSGCGKATAGWAVAMIGVWAEVSLQRGGIVRLVIQQTEIPQFVSRLPRLQFLASI